MKIHIWRKSWSFFIGYHLEWDQWRFEVNWGGKSTERALNGEFWYRNHIRLTSHRKPRFRYWFRRPLNISNPT